MYALQKLIRIREEQLVPGVARPAESVAGGILLIVSRDLVECGMPIHVNHEDVKMACRVDEILESVD